MHAVIMFSGKQHDAQTNVQQNIFVIGHKLIHHPNDQHHILSTHTRSNSKSDL